VPLNVPEPDAVNGDIAARETTFLSHSSEDGEFARELCSSLEARGLRCWIAPRDVTHSQPYALECVRGISESEAFLLLASETAIASRQVLSEVEQAHKRDKPIYTVLIPPAKLCGEMDFYLSRLHWIESGGRTAEEMAAKLAPVLAKEREWDEVAAPPSLRRTMQYRPVAFARTLAATVLGIVLVLGAVLFALNRTLDENYLRWGYVDLSAATTGNGNVVGQARVWLMAPNVRFADARLLAVFKTVDGKSSQLQVQQWPISEQMGSQEVVAIPFPPGARQLTTCLIVNSQRRVTQQFLLTSTSDGVRVSETAEKQVTRENSSPCQ
jgi:hypothetical protein